MEFADKGSLRDSIQTLSMEQKVRICPRNLNKLGRLWSVSRSMFELDVCNIFLSTIPVIRMNVFFSLRSFRLFTFLSVCFSICLSLHLFATPSVRLSVCPGNTKGGSITVPLTSCLTGLESAVWQLTIFVFICKTG